MLVLSAVPRMRLIHLKDLRLFKKACSLEGKIHKTWISKFLWDLCFLSQDFWAQTSKASQLIFAWKHVRESSGNWTGTVKGNLGCSSTSITALWKKRLPFSAWHSTGQPASRDQSSPFLAKLWLYILWALHFTQKVPVEVNSS